MMMFGWILIILFVYHITKDNNLAGTNKQTSKSLLDERYINGEIDGEDYLKMKKLIAK